MAKYFFDTEFIESGPHRPIDLISIGIVTEDEDSNKIRTYYAVCSEFDPNNASDWVKENVLSVLDVPEEGYKTLKQIKKDIIEFIGQDQKPEFWADYCAYDWVVFCQIFGTMMDLPDKFPYYCNDIQMLRSQAGNPDCPEQKGTEHNALDDAKHNLVCYKFLKKFKFTKNKFNLKEFRSILNKNRRKK